MKMKLGRDGSYHAKPIKVEGETTVELVLASSLFLVCAALVVIVFLILK